jgi:hypothetical protein
MIATMLGAKLLVEAAGTNTHHTTANFEIDKLRIAHHLSKKGRGGPSVSPSVLS